MALRMASVKIYVMISQGVPHGKGGPLALVALCRFVESCVILSIEQGMGLCCHVLALTGELGRCCS